jgi:multiple sugar transport system permease protein
MSSVSPTRTRNLFSGWSRKEVRKTLWGLLFISPWLIGFLWLTVYPIFASLFYSFTEYEILSAPKWVGLENYKEMFFNDKLFWLSIWNTIYFVFFTVTLGTVFSILLALLLNTKVRGMSVYRTVYYVPTVVPAVAGVMLWAWILHPSVGPINLLLAQIGVTGPNWFGNPVWTKPALILLGLWGLGASTIIYLAGLQDVPVHLYESAEIDGANSLQKTFHITIPMITPAILFNVVMGLIVGFQYFTAAFVGSGLSTNPSYGSVGGPLKSMLFFNLYLYQNAFGYFKMGYASAMAWFLLVLVLFLTWLIFKSTGRFVQYGR